MLYFGPETIMPLASALAVVTGALLLFWRRVVSLARAVFGRLVWLFGRRRRSPGLPTSNPAAVGETSSSKRGRAV